MRASPDELRVHFRGPVTVHEPSSEIRTWASFRVVPDNPAPELL